ncbi:MAG: phage holin family protein [Chromatiales bacterium]|mgnify:CR=1 FL=1|jgi:hypothetical protein
MERFVHSLRILWRTDRLLTQNEIRLLSKKLQLNALAGLVALFGLAMLSLAMFFALVPYWGESLAALAVGGADILLAALLIGYARSIKPAPEVEMIREMREVALNDLKDEVALADAELMALKDEVRSFLRNPVESILPAAIGPLLVAITRALKSRSK